MIGTQPAPGTEAEFDTEVLSALSPDLDRIAVSYNRCEQDWPAEAREALESAFAEATRLGVAMGYPGSSPWALAVGGTQLDLDGTIETGGQVAVERVWNEPSPN